MFVGQMDNLEFQCPHFPRNALLWKWPSSLFLLIERQRYLIHRTRIIKKLKNSWLFLNLALWNSKLTSNKQNNYSVNSHLNFKTPILFIYFLHHHDHKIGKWTSEETRTDPALQLFLYEPVMTPFFHNDWKKSTTNWSLLTVFLKKVMAQFLEALWHKYLGLN